MHHVYELCPYIQIYGHYLRRQDSCIVHIYMQMTIKYNNEKGMEFRIDVKINEDNSILVLVELCSTRSPALAKKTFMIPYGHDGIIPPFDFNILEEGIHNILKVMYKDSRIGEFRQEDMVETIDMLMMHEASVIDIRIADEYDVCTNVCV
ncbi:putative C1 protein [Chili leaf curl betasatellite]|uniref:C1 protein n=2 Tax=Viruses TaxID=10239 RepID=Q7T476_9VIRU|nr:putative C1 protein [Chili leaf curl betasatellite]CAN39447.1 beta C1 protein [Cotton leaf curl virus-[Pakistan:Multan]]CAC87058.1 putative C1 protein [Chili leaf curl betasatellite]CAN39448.1 beta C1 protein [Cotton leaf curl virus-[Pakistan:Multan]]CAN39452.1 beta C1 protein [Cotton leaf curl virus-[Pakistan:Multan]]CAN39454.1 beta C1 protein [Cotton leaf curl virus-[Pakistan:Multan]]